MKMGGKKITQPVASISFDITFIRFQDIPTDIFHEKILYGNHFNYS